MMLRHSFGYLNGYVGDNKRVYHALLESVNEAGLTVLNAVKHEFWPHGLSAVVVLGESHMAIHTYPEDEKIYINCFTCGDVTPDLPISIFRTKLGLDNGRIETHLMYQPKSNQSS